MTLYNCTAYRNGTNYSISRALDSGKALIVVNCVSVGSYGSLGSFAAQQTNSWLSPFNVSNADFVSADTAGVRGPRKADGSLPDITFMHLAPGSWLIDAGTALGLPYNGSAPDLGAFETGSVTDVQNDRKPPSEFTLEQNFPNPFNPTTIIWYWLPSAGPVSLRVYDALGREVAVLVTAVQAPGEHHVNFDASALPSGVYLARLTGGAQTKIIKLVLTK